MESISEIEENGDNFKVTITTGQHVIANTFTVGKESEMVTITGEKVKVSQDSQLKLGLLVRFINPLAY